MSSLAQLRYRLTYKLADSDGSEFDDDLALDEAIRTALASYSRIRPLSAIGTITLTSDSREIDVSGLTGLIDVREVWCPYTAADPEYPPNRRAATYWGIDLDLVYLDDDYSPSAGDVARIFYDKLQTIDGLDGATATTVSPAHLDGLLLGAAGYAADVRSLDLDETVTLDKDTAKRVREWGQARLKEFNEFLRSVVRENYARGSARIGLGKLDRWDERSPWA